MDEVQSSHGTARKQQIVLMQVTLDSFDHRVSEGQQLRQDRATDRDRNFSQSGGNAPKGRTFTLPYHFVEPPNWSSNPLTARGKGGTGRGRSERAIIHEGKRFSQGGSFILPE